MINTNSLPLAHSGAPGMSPGKYYLGGKYDGAIQPMEEEKQTLKDANIELIDGQTVMSFTKILKEEGEIEILTGHNIFLWAHGIDAANPYHGSNRNSFELNLLKNGSTETEFALETSSPSSSPQKVSTPKPSKQPVSKVPTIPPTKRPSQKPSNQPTVAATKGPLLTLLLQRSPGSAENLSDNSSEQYRAMQWLLKNPDIGSITDDQMIQRWALVTFYRSLHGEEWTNRTGWLDVGGDVVDECTWYNVICNPSGIVKGLDLSFNYLWGDVPMEIVLLDQLGE
eukprot:scaffold852_cov197-Alexandrium_tamarense.AAC.39